MRTCIGLSLAAICLGLLGCAGPRPKQDPADAPGMPFTGAKLTRPPRGPTGPPAETDVLLAGQVVEKAFGKRVPDASIQLVDLEDANPTPAARLDFRANSDGYFFIPGLVQGHHYQLIARSKDGDHLLSGVTLAAPPNPRLSIYISEDLTSPSTPPPLSPPTPPNATPSTPTAPPSADRQSGTPPAVLSPPKPTPGSGAAAPSTPPLNKIAEGPPPESGGFQKIPAPPTASVPNPKPNPVLPPPPAFNPAPPPAAPPAAPPPTEQARHEVPALRSAPPFCVLEGNRLDNFSLPTVDGQPWEFRRDPPRKLVLLDFWKSNCAPCREAVPHLVQLQSAYGQAGLEVVGIAYEDGGPSAKQGIREVRLRNNINYTILIGADSQTGPCPVRTQFLVDRFPQLVLIDETGDILWRSNPQQPLSDQFSELTRTIDHKLNGNSH
ncbi:MAG TPA: redoxin family protein [Gemmataceae bacterium]|nr:redoxin family protein [Gemmataceae bacterium]